MILQYCRLLLKRLHHYLCRLVNWLSLGFIQWHASPYYLSDYYLHDKHRPKPVGKNSNNNSGGNSFFSSPRGLLASLRGGFSNSFGCLSSGGSSDSEPDLASSNSSLNIPRRRSQRTQSTAPATSTYQHMQQNMSQSIANDAVAHSYDDITSPDYHNYLWLSSPYDRTDLFSAPYFLPNWIHFFLNEFRKSREADASTTTADSDAATEEKTSYRLKLVFNWGTARASLMPCKTFSSFLQNLVFAPDSFFPRRRVTLPKRQKTLVIDLDETLIHSTAASCANFDFMIEVLISRTSCLYYVFKRPHLDYFLDIASNWFNLVIYTASLREYADPVIDVIDEGRKYFKRRLFRSSCSVTSSNNYLKDLALVDSDLSRLCLLDNSAASFALQPDNAIPIESWRDDRTDTALLELLPFLDALRFVEDVRSVLSLRRLSLFSVINK